MEEGVGLAERLEVSRLKVRHQLHPIALACGVSLGRMVSLFGSICSVHNVRLGLGPSEFWETLAGECADLKL